MFLFVFFINQFILKMDDALKSSIDFVTKNPDYILFRHNAGFSVVRHDLDIDSYVTDLWNVDEKKWIPAVSGNKK